MACSGAGVDPGLRQEWDEILRTMREDMERNLRKQELYVERLLVRYSHCSQALQEKLQEPSTDVSEQGTAVRKGPFSPPTSFSETDGPTRKGPPTSAPTSFSEQESAARKGDFEEVAGQQKMLQPSRSPSRSLTPTLEESPEPFAQHLLQLRDKPSVDSSASELAPTKSEEQPSSQGEQQASEDDNTAVATTTETKDDAMKGSASGRPRMRRMSSVSVNSSLARSENAVISQLVEVVSKKSPILGRMAEPVLVFIDRLYNLQEPPRSGRLAAFLKSSTFTLGIGAIIMTNAVWTFYLADWSISHLDEPMEDWHKYVEVGFCAVWVLEFMMKLVNHRLYFFWNDDMKWNLLDTFLVILTLLDQVAMWVDTGGPGVNLSFLRSVKILRLGRVLRLFRIFRLFRELRNIVNSLLGSMVSLFWCLVMLTFMLTLFALAFVILITDHLEMASELQIPEENDLRFHFGSVGRTMTSLYMATTGGEDWHNFYHLVGTAGWHLQVLFLMFVSFFNLAVFNVLTGIFVDNAMKITKMDEGKLIIEQKRKENSEANALKKLCEGMDDDSSGTITWDKFMHHITNPTVAAHFAAVGVEIHDAEAFFKILTKASGSPEVDIDIFVKCCIRMKGYATSIDMQTLAYEVRCIRKETAKLSSKRSLQLGDDVDSIMSSMSPRSCSPNKAYASPPRTPTRLSRSRKLSKGEGGHHVFTSCSFEGADSSGTVPSWIMFRSGEEIQI